MEWSDVKPRESTVRRLQSIADYYIPHKWIVLFTHANWLARRWLAKYNSPPLRWVFVNYCDAYSGLQHNCDFDHLFWFLLGRSKLRTEEQHWWRVRGHHYRNFDENMSFAVERSVLGVYQDDKKLILNSVIVVTEFYTDFERRTSYIFQF